MEKVSFTNASLASLPPSFFNNTSLKEVCLCNNNLFQLPDIPKSNTIRYLSLDINPFNKLPSSITNLQELQTLGLKGCRFTEFPKEILELKSIKTLDLSDNPISHIPENLSELSSLENLYIIKTQIKEIPKSMKNSSLKRVFISDDPLTEEQKKNIIENLPSDCIIEWTNALNYIIDINASDCSGIKPSYIAH